MTAVSTASRVSGASSRSRASAIRIGLNLSPTLAPALTIGIGLGGFVDGIVAHQILGWHHMLSARTGDMRTNEVADGLFHAGAWVIVLAGIL